MDRLRIGAGMRARALAGVALAGVAALAMGFAASAPAHAADKVSVALNTATGAGYAIYIGKDKGFFAEEGIDLQVVKTTTPAAGNAAVASGDADLAIYSLSAGFFNVAANSDFVVIGEATAEKPGFIGTTFVASNDAYNKGLKSAADLGGKKVAIGSLSGGAEYDTYLIAEKYHIPFDSIHFVTLGGDANNLAAVKVGTVDAGVTGSGLLAIAAEKAGDSHIIARAADEVPGLQAVLFSNKKAVANRHEILVRFMRAYLKATALYAETFEKLDASGNFARTPQATAILDDLSKDTSVPADAIATGLQYITPDASFDPKEVTDQIAVWRKLNLVDPGVDPNMHVVDLSILHEAQKK